MRGFGLQADWSSRADEIESKYVIADWCSTWGHASFMGKAGLGIQLPVVGELNKSPSHALATIIAYDQLGLEGIYELASLASTQTYYRPRVTWEQIKEAMQGHGTAIVDAITPGELSSWAETEFGFIAIQHSPSFLWLAAKEYPAVIAPGAQYPRPGDRPLFDVVKAVGRQHQAGELGDRGSHMLSKADLDVGLRASGLDMDKLWGVTDEVGGQIAYVTPRPARLLSPAHLPALSSMVLQGIKDRFGVDGMPADYAARLTREMEVINDKDFGDYFRFVGDVVRHAKSNFLVGPGRGSSGGSLLCYILGITDVDPIRHNTMFARFVDPGRSDLPDIDVDFPDVRRDDVFAYLRDQYGEAQVAKLGTVSTWHAASALNDVARVEEIDRDDARKLKSLCAAADEPLLTVLGKDDDAKEILARFPAVGLAARLEGMPRHSGVHPAGVLVSNDTLTQFGTVSGAGILSVDGNGAEDLGLLKFDALGLRTLSVIQECLRLADLSPTDYHNLTLTECHDDIPEALRPGVDKVYEKIFQADRVTGVFQFEGEAVRGLGKKVKVACFSDLCALTSLARPGPLYSGQADRWCATHNGELDVNFIDDRLREVTGETYGQIVYQEQAMAVTRELAGFDDHEVNLFRKAMGKKVAEDMAAMRDKFVEGYMETSHNRRAAEDIFDMLEEYSGYAFNKSHAVAYSMLTYVTAWLKCYYPREFVCAQLRCQDDEKRTKGLLRDLTAEGIEYVPFDLETSELNWSIQGEKVIGGFTAVRGIGKKTAEACIAKRDADPEGWTRELTVAQRSRLLSPFNTPWHDLTRMSEVYGHVYEDPTKIGVRKGVIHQIEDVPEIKGSYVFLGKLTKAVERENKKGKMFINLYFEDDSGDCGCTINQFKAGGYKGLLETDALNKDYLVRADLIEDGRKWFFLDKIKEIEA